jgi:hypothetical protein
MAGGFKRSGLFGLIGVVVAAIVVAVIASSAGNEANPKGTLALIFGVIAVFVVILFVLQRSDLERAAGGDAKAVQRVAAEGGGKIENPTTMGRTAALGGARDQANRQRGDQGTARSRFASRRVVVARKGGAQADWLCDLWLAERLADAA